MSLESRINDLREKGLSYNAIVSELNCSKSTVSYYLSAEGKLRKVKRTRDRRNKHAKFIIEYKMNSLCFDCGLDYPYWILEFDHRGKEEKLYNISFMVRNFALDAIKEEIAKCDVVCANCHRHRTWLRATKSDNGTYGSTQG